MNRASSVFAVSQSLCPFFKLIAPPFFKCRTEVCYFSLAVSFDHWLLYWQRLTLRRRCFSEPRQRDQLPAEHQPVSIQRQSRCSYLSALQVDVCVAALTDLSVKGRSNITLQADALLEDVKGMDFDCLVLPGGPGTKLIREDARVSV